jgi:hypothetical protein
LLQDHGQIFEKQSVHYPSTKDLISEIVKMVMVVPFSDKVMPVPQPDTSQPDVEVIEEPSNKKDDKAAVSF